MPKGASRSWLRWELGPSAKLGVAIMSGFCQTQTSGTSIYWKTSAEVRE
jgi:hypothetical protein